jgi:hypothetical protein
MHGNTADPSLVEGYALKKAFLKSKRFVQDIFKKSIIELLFFHSLFMA